MLSSKVVFEATKVVVTFCTCWAGLYGFLTDTFLHNFSSDRYFSSHGELQDGFPSDLGFQFALP